MAELADAADSKSADLRVLGVRLPLPAPALVRAGGGFGLSAFIVALTAVAFVIGLLGIPFGEETKGKTLPA